jgi:hypothetical protein
VFPVQALASIAAPIEVGYLICRLQIGPFLLPATAVVMQEISRRSRPRSTAIVTDVGMLFDVGLLGLLVVLGGAALAIYVTMSGVSSSPLPFK